MPPSTTFICDSCDFYASFNDVGFFFLKDNGEEIILGHPCEGYQIAQLMGISEEEEVKLPHGWWMKLENLGTYSTDYCYKCKDFVIVKSHRKLPYGQKCPNCGSEQIFNCHSCEGAPCPSCKEGSLIIHSRGFS